MLAKIIVTNEVRHFHLLRRETYSYLSASMGLMEAALREGRKEKTRFNAAAAAKASTALFLLKTNGNPTAALIKREVGQETIIPMSPPPSASAAVSQVT